jgi:CrcB protein
MKPFESLGLLLSFSNNPAVWKAYGFGMESVHTRVWAKARLPSLAYRNVGRHGPRIDKPTAPPQSRFMSLTLPLIALGGAAGSVLRYLMVSAIGAPLGTTAVNVLGSFVIGVLFILIGSREGWHLFLMTGVLGGFTTFSAFSLDALKLVQSGQTLQAAVYILGSVALSLVAVALGVALARSFA